MSFPLSALCGQEKMQLALLLLGVNPRLKGVLLTGEKGTAKSTAARALATLLEQPFLNVPLSVTEEALLGSLKLEAAFAGKKLFQPGLLAQADGGVVYVDEINLLARPLLHALLHVLDTGEVFFEREGFSLKAPARFVLIGSMNPEEGPLPAQILDRFGLCVAVKAERDPALRVEIVKRRLAYERDPEDFYRQYAQKEKELRSRLLAARKRLARVRLPEKIFRLISVIAQEAAVSGHRAEIMLTEAAKAHAALKGRVSVELEDLEAVKELVLYHRRREKKTAPKKKKAKTPPPQPPKSTSKEETRAGSSPKTGPSSPLTEEEETGKSKPQPGLGPPSRPPEEKPFPIGEVFKPQDLSSSDTATPKAARLGRSSRALTLTGPGYYLRPVPYQGEGQIALLPTLISAALKGGARPLKVAPADLKAKLKLTKTSRLLLFCVDGSGSMAAQARMKETKGAIMSLLISAYQKRDQAALVVFRDQRARLVLPPTSSVERAGRLLRDLTVGGSTPLSHALFSLRHFLRTRLRQHPHEEITVILITDGRGNVSLTGKPPKEEGEALARSLRLEFPQVQFVIVDTETGPVRLEMARELARVLSARYFTPESLKADRLLNIIREVG